MLHIDVDFSVVNVKDSELEFSEMLVELENLPNISAKLEKTCECQIVTHLSIVPSDLTFSYRYMGQIHNMYKWSG